jgi:AraC-like DNA-binding protein
MIVRPPRDRALRSLVASLAVFEGALPPGRERVLPAGDVSLIVNLHEDELRTYHGPALAIVRRARGAALAGPRTRHVVIDTEEQRHLVWVGSRLAGAAPFLSTPLAEARDALVDLEDVWGRDGAVLRERILETATDEERLAAVERALLERLRPALERDPAVVVALRALERGVRVAALGTRLGLSSRQLGRRFLAATGVTPKRFARVRRLQRTVRKVAAGGPVEWAQVAFEHGYYDQSHLVHDFGELAGITPTAYRPRSPGDWNHVPAG